jgi:hypothetical protein
MLFDFPFIALAIGSIAFPIGIALALFGNFERHRFRTL